MHPKKSFISVLVMLLLCCFSYAQQQKEKDFDRIYVGGNASMGFGSATNIYISPIVGYRFTKNFSAGPGVTYQYWKYQEYSYNSYGGKVFARYTPLDFLILQTEYEVLSISRGISSSDRSDETRTTFNGWFLGAGYVKSLGGNSMVSFMVLYNLIENEYTPYDSNPTYRVGLNFGL